MATATVQERPQEAHTLSGRARRIAFLTIALGMLLSALDSTVVSTALPTIVGDLGGGDHVSWVVTSYLLAQTVVTAVIGKFGDQFGRKPIFQLSVAMFIIGSALCGMAQDMGWLIGSRAIQGLGAGGLTVTATALIADIIPLRERGRYQGSLGAVFGITTVLGPLLGGFFTDNLSWRWVFYINVPLALVVIVVAGRTLPSVRAQGRQSIDYLGMLLITIGASCLVLATSWGGTTHPWGSPTIIGLFAGGAVGLAAFVLVERRAVEPILPMRLFRHRVFWTCCALSFVVGFAMMGSITFLPTFLQYVNGVSATASGVRMLPMVLGLMATAITSGNIVSRTGHYKIFPVVGTPVIALGLVLLSRLDETTSVLQEALSMFVLGLGIGASMQVLTIIVQNTVAYRDLGVATSAVTFFRTLGGAFGAAVFGSLYSNFLSGRLPEAIAATRGAVTPTDATTPSALHDLPDRVIQPVVHAYAESIGHVFAWAAPVALLGLLLALMIPQVALRHGLQPGATDLGEGFGMPESSSAEERLASRIARLVYADHGRPVADILQDADVGLDEGRTWALLQVHGRNREGQPASLSGIARAHRVPPILLQPAFESLLRSGHLGGSLAQLTMTETGAETMRALGEYFRQWILARLDGIDSVEAPTVDAAIQRITQRLLQEIAESDQEPVAVSS
ncbi:MDR family MFS transporter [Aeromicrobium chenweiae]|uniref:MFS transporter n=1 Tax=Aeromicrobium chenweiae TaxID=2079793 RepID=A0A2S0WQ18_9ACTN|nr:MDR family MFS transporter [Aeromicrobium chenweiae]AWB93334.1 MFS transporter [Aeromicrobium chenweiae]TGN34324.1 DHA2 family efflux MFS transporter permease subunit [Aeromicrobium chenweiae]